MGLSNLHDRWPALHRYGLATVLFVGAIALRFAIAPERGGTPFVTFYPAILLGFYLCGPGPGILVTALSAAAGEYFFRAPYRGFSDDPLTYPPLICFLLTATLVGAVVYSLHRNARVASEGEARWKFALEGMGDGVWDWDLDNDRTFYSKRWKEILGYSQKEIGTSKDEWLTRVHPEDLPRVMDNFRNRMEGKSQSSSVEFRMRCKDGQWKWIHGRGMVVERDSTGRPHRIVGAIGDVGERMRIERALRESELKFRTLFEAANDGIFLLETAGFTFVDCNARGAAMYGQSRAQVIGCSPQDFSPERQPNGRPSAEIAREKIAEALRGQAPVFEWQSVRSDGTPFDVELTLNRIDLGDQTFLQAIVRDITERKRMEDELRKMASTDFLTGLPNRRTFVDRLEDEFARLCRAVEQRAALLMVDLDRFKTVNDRYGHAGGDALLKHFGALVSRELRRIDTAGRLGGEEFGIVLPGDDLDAAMRFAARLRQRVLDTPLDLDGQSIPFTVSIGVTQLDVSDASPDAALARADKALYRAKNLGRDRIETG